MWHCGAKDHSMQLALYLKVKTYEQKVLLHMHESPGIQFLTSMRDSICFAHINSRVVDNQEQHNLFRDLTHLYQVRTRDGKSNRIH